MMDELHFDVHENSFFVVRGCGSGSHADVRDPSRALCGDVCHVWILVSCVDRARQRVDLEEGRACAGMLPVLV